MISSYPGLKKSLKRAIQKNPEVVRDLVSQLESSLGIDLGNLIREVIGNPKKAPDPLTAQFVGLTKDNSLAFFNDNNLSRVTTIDVTGLQYGETLLGIDFRPNTGELFGLGSSNRLYTIDVTTGNATQVGTGTFAVPLNGTNFGFDFNPTVDRIRVVSDTGQNLRLNPDTGAVVDGNPMMDGIQPDRDLNGATMSIVGTAYTNNFTGATTTTQYGINADTDQLFIQAPPNAGTQTLVGSLGFDFGPRTGLDIVTKNGVNTAFAVSNSSFYTINLDTGAASFMGTVKDRKKPLELVGFAARSPIVKPNPLTAEFIGLTEDSNLVFFNSSALNNVTRIDVTGLEDCETLLGIDVRPNTGQLFALSSNNRLYTIDRATGAASRVGEQFAVYLEGENFGFDFNPTVDRIRVVSDAGQNLRLNPDNGMVVDGDPMMAGIQTDGRLNGATRSIVATAYTNSFAGATTTTQYGIDAITDQLFIQAPPNAGTQTLVGSLGVDFSARTGFDIVFRNGANAAFATSDSSFYSVDLNAGSARLLGQIRDGVTPLNLIGFAAAA